MAGPATPADDRGMRIPNVIERAKGRNLASLAFLAALFPAWSVLRGLYLSLYFERTDTALHAARTGKGLVIAGALAGVVLLAVAVGLRWIELPSSEVLTGGVAVTVSIVLGLTGLAWVHADRALHNYGPELRAVAAFVPPSGATEPHDVRRASANPEVKRSWRVPTPLDDLCRRSVERFEAWADPGSVAKVLPKASSSCSHRGRRGPDQVELLVGEWADGGSLQIVARRL